MEKSPSEMTEEERAEYYERHRDDDSLFLHRAVDIGVRRGGKTSTMFSLRIPAAELTKIGLAAKARGLTVSEFIRRASLAAAEDEDATTREAAIGDAKRKARELADSLSRL